MTTPTRTVPLYGILLLVSLSLFWGLNWPGMKIALGEITVWWFRAMSVTVGGLGLLGVAAITDKRLMPTRAEIGPLIVCATFGMLGWHVLTAYGVSIMPAGRASIIAFTMPVWAALLATVFLSERMTLYKVAGLILGLCGLVVLIGPDLGGVQAAPLGAFFMLGAAMSWPLGTVLFKRFEWSLPVISSAGWQLTMAAGVITLKRFR